MLIIQTSDFQIDFAISQLKLKKRRGSKASAKRIILGLMENEARLQESYFRLDEISDQWSRAETIIKTKGKDGVEYLKSLLRDHQRQAQYIQQFLNTIETPK